MFLLRFLLSLPNNVWRLIVFAPFLLIIIKSPKQRLETYCFCSVSYYYFHYYYSYSFFPRSMKFSTTDLRNYRTEFHETWWIYRYMFLVDPKVFRFVVKGVKAIFLGVQRWWGLLLNPMGNLKFRTLMLITSNWIMKET